MHSIFWLAPRPRHSCCWHSCLQSPSLLRPTSGSNLNRRNSPWHREKSSIRSDGHLTLAPQFKELDSTTVPYLWAVAQDSKGVALLRRRCSYRCAPLRSTRSLPGEKPRVYAEISQPRSARSCRRFARSFYAAVLPDAKIYRIEKGKPQIFFDAKCKYIWSMAFDKGGKLFVATGDAGLIYKVAPDGTGAKFFDTEETHARSMVIDSEAISSWAPNPAALFSASRLPARASFSFKPTNAK